MTESFISLFHRYSLRCNELRKRYRGAAAELYGVMLSAKKKKLVNFESCCTWWSNSERCRC